MRFQNRAKDYLKVISFGLTAGVLVRLTDLLSMSTLWSFPTIATLYGFWIVSCCLLVWYSTSHLTAGLNVLFYLFFTTVAYYGLQFLLGLFVPRFDIGGFPTKLFLEYVLASVACGILALLLYCWNHKSWYASILLAAPIGFLASETLSVLILLQRYQTHLFQLIFNAGFCLYLGIQFRKKAPSRELFSVSVILIAGVVYYFVYNRWL